MRIPFFIGIRVARALLSPFFYMAAAILVKKLFIGKFEPGMRDTSNQWQLLSHHLSANLLSRDRFQAVADIVGRHYELVSCLYRLVGAKVGKRVFWPGYQPVFSGEFDLLEIGDDVVFGSRSTILFATVDTCEKVTLCAGSNVSDNCVVLPGSSIGKNAVLGSNSVCPEGWYLPEESVWFGSKGSEPTCLKRGTDAEFFNDGPMLSCCSKDKMQMGGDDSTLRPFGKAFYLRQASYYVWPLSWIISATVVIKTFIAVFHTLPLLGALYGAAGQLYGWSLTERDFTIEYKFYEV
jgi:serine acetyltransferase